MQRTIKSNVVMTEDLNFTLRSFDLPPVLLCMYRLIHQQQKAAGGPAVKLHGRPLLCVMILQWLFHFETGLCVMQKHTERSLRTYHSVRNPVSLINSEWSWRVRRFSETPVNQFQ